MVRHSAVTSSLAIAPAFAVLACRLRGGSGQRRHSGAVGRGVRAVRGECSRMFVDPPPSRTSLGSIPLGEIPTIHGILWFIMHWTVAAVCYYSSA